MAQLLIGAERGLTYDEARLRLDCAALVISAEAAAMTRWGQAAILTIARCGVRMFKGGVHLRLTDRYPMTVGASRARTLVRELRAIGCRLETAPDHAVCLHVGHDGAFAGAALHCWADGWLASIGPRTPEEHGVLGNELAGALAGALAVSECFRSVVLGDVRALKRPMSLSPLNPANPTPDGFDLTRLPRDLWLLGLGNLGQALLWVLSLLPYRDRGEVFLLLQDMDESGPENLDTQILTSFDWIGHKKARNAAAWAEACGFRTAISERCFGVATRPDAGEPRVALVGVDNLATRRLAAGADFDLLIDLGLGHSAAEIFDLRLHGFPGSRAPQQAWPESEREDVVQLNPALEQLVNEGRLDRCGAMTIAGKSVGVPATAVAASVIQLTQLCRAIVSGTYCDRVSLTTVDPKRAFARDGRAKLERVLPFALAETG